MHAICLQYIHLGRRSYTLSKNRKKRVFSVLTVKTVDLAKPADKCSVNIVCKFLIIAYTISNYHDCTPSIFTKSVKV